jgi:Asp-tRNA(Asn)/Glu-tRNA(Gln) amidotransferase A subunit family amidase
MPALPLTVQEAAAAFRDGTLTSVELTTALLARADRLDPELGTFLARFDGPALERAAHADDELRAGHDRGPLHGVPIGVKDILAAAEGPTTAQSLVLDPAWGAGKDAPVVRRLREAGAVIVGKTTTMEFAIGLPDPAKPFPVPRNPWDTSTWAGGSSSGTGNGVAAGMFLAGVGTDTGGSIRIPAAFCGVTGHMPTFSLVPKSGCTPLGFTLDHVGPLARSAWDCAAMLTAMAGHDPSDPYSADRSVPDYVAALDGVLAGTRIGVVSFPDQMAPGVRSCFDDAVATLGRLGAETTGVVIPLYHEVTAASLVTMAAEACAYHHNDLASRWGDYAHRTRVMVTWGALVSGADYVQAQRVRRVGQRALAGVLGEVDLIVTPTTSVTAPPLASMDNVGEMLGRIHTPYWDAVGNPVLAVPIGFADGMPVSMQIAGSPFADAAVLRAGDAYQRVTDWHRRVPELALDHAGA